MSYKTVRQGVAAAMLTVVTLVLPAAGAQGGSLHPEGGGRAARRLEGRGGFSLLWAVLVNLLEDLGCKNRAGIDPNGAAPPGTTTK